MVVYRDPDTGQFTSYNNASERGLEPEVIQYEWETRNEDREDELDELEDEDDIDYSGDEDMDYSDTVDWDFDEDVYGD